MDNDAKQVLIVAGLLVLVFAALIIVTQLSSPDPNFIKTLFGDDQRRVSISGTDRQETINDLDKRINLRVNGQSIRVIVTKNTEIRDIYFTGIDNIVTLCRGIHNPTILDHGIKNVIAYVDC